MSLPFVDLNAHRLEMLHAGLWMTVAEAEATGHWEALMATDAYLVDVALGRSDSYLAGARAAIAALKPGESDFCLLCWGQCECRQAQVIELSTTNLCETSEAA